MKKLLCNIGILLMSILLLSAAELEGQEINKDFNREFVVDGSTSVNISNRYGDVIVKTWNNDAVRITVKVTVEMSSLDRAQRVMDMIDIEFTDSDNTVGAKTILNNRFSSATRGSSSNRFSIDYEVFMPANNNLSISNRYGNINLPELNGHIELNLSYGNLFALKLTRGNTRPVNHISASYGKVVIDEVNWMSIYSRYVSEFVINKGQALTIESRYSKFNIDEISSIVADTKYDEISVRTIKNIISEGSYTGYKLGIVETMINLKARYGSFSTEYMPAGFSSVNIDASYCSVNIGVDRTASYKLDASVKSSNLTYCEDCIEITKRIIESGNRQIVGMAGGDPATEATIFIRSSYGSVRLKQ